MELIQLEYFIKAAELQNFTQAAAELHVSQPGLSKAVSKLEDELGAQLFSRDKSKVCLNDDGLLFLSCARKVISLLEKAKTDISQRNSDRSNRIFFSNDMQLATRRLISVFMDSHPEITLFQTRLTPERLIAELKSGTIDVALCRAKISDQDVAWQRFRIDNTFVIISADNALAKNERLSFAELKNESFLLRGVDSFSYDKVVGFCKASGFEPNIAYAGISPETIYDLISQDRGVAILGEATARVEFDMYNCSAKRILAIPLDDEGCVRELGILTLKNRTLPRAARLLVDYLRSNI